MTEGSRNHQPAGTAAADGRSEGSAALVLAGVIACFFLSGFAALLASLAMLFYRLLDNTHIEPRLCREANSSTKRSSRAIAPTYMPTRDMRPSRNRKVCARVINF